MRATPAPTIGRIVQYRGRQGFLALRPAMVVATVDTLHPDGVATGQIPPLSSRTHVHLHVLTPSDQGFFTEYDVPQDEPGFCRPGTWQWPTVV